MSRFGQVLGVALIAAAIAGSAIAQDYPTRPVTFVTSEAGGSSDTAARLVAAHLSEMWGQPIVVESVNNNIGGQKVAQSAPDGYTVLFTGSTFWIGQLFRDLPFNPTEDFTPVTMLSSSPILVLVQPELPVTSVADLVTLVRSKPGEFNYGVGSVGSAGFLAAELLKSMAGLDMVRVLYGGASDSVNALLGGEVQMAFVSSASGMQQVSAGTLTGLAVTSTEPSETAPGIPTVASSDLPGYEVTSSVGVFVADGTPDEIVEKLSHDIAQVVSRADVRTTLIGLGFDPIGSTPADFSAKITAEVARIGKLVEDENLRPE